MTSRGTRLANLLDRAGLLPLGNPGADPLITGVTLDSRRVEAGDLFVAVKGFRLDGNVFARDAIRRGARAVLSASPRPDWVDAGVAWVRVEDPRSGAAPISRECHARPDENLTIVGITGTNGKTTVAHLVESIAAAAGKKAGRIGTVGYAFAGREWPAPHTTPESPDLYRLLAAMREESIDIVAMEVSSHALALHRVEGVRFATAAFLNLSRDHLDFHGDEESYFAAKATLFETLTEREHAVLPADSSSGERLHGRTRARVITFGRSEAAQVRLRDEHCGVDGSSAILDTPLGTLPVRTFLLGRFNLENVAAAAACAVATGLPAESIPAGVLALQAVPGRMEKLDRGQPFTVLVDYAHTEAALSSLLGWVRELSRGGIHLVFGCGGNRDRGKRFAMGRAAAEAADAVYLTSDNPRDEDPREILGEIERGVASVEGGLDRCSTIPDRRAAIHAAISAARPDDVVLVAGKGHETTQCFRNRVEPFDDRRVASQVLESLGWDGRSHAGA